MKYSYRITKYGHLGSERPDDEWTSFYDIGKTVSEEEYLAVETDYVQTIIAISRCLRVSSLTVSGLELNSDCEPYTEGQEIEVDGLASVVEALLRERIWCKLKSSICEFHFGYDYYMYLVSEVDAASCFPHEKSKLNFEVFQSPYIDQQV
jgi:hypothetical protein